MFLRVSSSMRILLIKEEKLRILKKINENKQGESKAGELKNYLQFLDEQLKIYPEIK